MAAAVPPELPPELWVSILSKLPLRDLLRSAGVCSLWRSIILIKKLCSPQTRIPWLILPDLSATHDTICIVDTTAPTPSHQIPLPAHLHNARTIGACRGWLIVVQEPDLTIRAFNPITRSEILFPPTPTLPGIITLRRNGVVDHLMQPMVPSLLDRGNKPVNPSCFTKGVLTWHAATPSCTLVLFYDSCRRMAFAREGDEAWSALRMPEGAAPWRFIEGLFHRDLFYAIDEMGRVAMFDICAGGSCVETIPVVVRDEAIYRYLVELPDDGGLLQVQLHSIAPYTRHYSFVVLRLNADRLEWVRVETLGGGGLFLGNGKCVFVSSVPSTIRGVAARGNCVYFLKHGSICVFDLEDRCIKDSIPVSGSSTNSRWIFPSLA